jgi:hypothetical protein
MTIPANFPEKMRMRRVGALARLKDKNSQEADILRERIGSERNHRGVKTKKDHTHLAKIRRG